MGTQSIKETVDQRTDHHQRPMQTVPWNEKTQEWYRKNVRHYINKANFSFGTDGNQRKDLTKLYGVYNGKFPMEWFKHVTNPLSSKKKQHQNYPGKIRPLNILRTNIDLLLGEWPRRPFIYNVSNLGESGYSRFMEGMQQQANQTLTEHFLRAALEEMQASGRQLTPEEMEKLKADPPVPEQVKKTFQSSYKDNIAIKGQKYLKRCIREMEIKKRMHKMFKDWLIAGECYSYKSVENGQLVYNRISPICLDYDKTHSSEFIEDGEWVVYRDALVLSDVVDRFYMQLREQHVKELENNYTNFAHYANPTAFYNYLSKSYSDNPLGGNGGKIPVFHVQWKGRKKIGFLTYLDMETFQMVEEVVDENYVVDREAGEQVEWRWVNEVYEGWQIGDDIFCNLQPVEAQRNEMSNLSTCKLSYNGRKYSDTHAENTSVTEIGLPIQILYIITGYILEKTIAKSKGKIVMMDKKTIPTDGDWDEEKFFYYGDAMGYALLDRSQPGVDKSWNQYQVLDLSLFDKIKQLIEIQESLKQQWDDIIGISRQRKGQTSPSDGQGVNERAVFQSTVITDMIFLGFDELVQRELQGILDLSRYTINSGIRSLYNDDEVGTTVLELMPEDFMFEELGVFVTDASEELRKLNDIKEYAQAMMQNGAKISTIIEVVESDNLAELKQTIRKIEAIEAEMEAAMQDAEYDAQAAADERSMRIMAYESLLETKKMHEEYDRKEDLELIQVAGNTFTFQDGDSNDNGVPDITEIQKLLQGQQKITADIEDKRAQRAIKMKEVDLKVKELEHKISSDRVKAKQTDKKLKIDAKKASQRPKATKK